MMRQSISFSAFFAAFLLAQSAMAQFYGNTKFDDLNHWSNQNIDQFVDKTFSQNMLPAFCPGNFQPSALNSSDKKQLLRFVLFAPSTLGKSCYESYLSDFSHQSSISKYVFLRSVAHACEAVDSTQSHMSEQSFCEDQKNLPSCTGGGLSDAALTCFDQNLSSLKSTLETYIATSSSSGGSGIERITGNNELGGNASGAPGSSLLSRLLFPGAGVPSIGSQFSDGVSALIPADVLRRIEGTRVSQSMQQGAAGNEIQRINPNPQTHPVGTMQGSSPPNQTPARPAPAVPQPQATIADNGANGAASPAPIAAPRPTATTPAKPIGPPVPPVSTRATSTQTGSNVKKPNHISWALYEKYYKNLPPLARELNDRATLALVSRGYIAVGGRCSAWVRQVFESILKQNLTGRLFGGVAAGFEKLRNRLTNLFRRNSTILFWAGKSTAGAKWLLPYSQVHQYGGLRPGDVVFYQTTAFGNAGHIGIVIINPNFRVRSFGVNSNHELVVAENSLRSCVNQDPKRCPRENRGIVSLSEFGRITHVGRYGGFKK